MPPEGSHRKAATRDRQGDEQVCDRGRPWDPCYPDGVHPLVKGALFCAALAAIGSQVRVPVSSTTDGPAAKPAPSLQEMPCPPRHLPEGDVCVPLLGSNEPLVREENVQRERRARGKAFDLLPRRPDREEDPRAYLYPIGSPPLILRGFDDVSTQPADASPTSIELSAERGTPVVAIRLAGQEGPTRVAETGRLVGNTVVTRHDVKEGERVRTYLLVHGRLDAFGPDVKAGAEIADGQTLGFVGDSGSPGLVRLYLEARRAREEVSLDGLALAKLVDDATGVPTDLRNVLPPIVEGKNAPAPP